MDGWLDGYLQALVGIEHHTVLMIVKVPTTPTPYMFPMPHPPAMQSLWTLIHHHSHHQLPHSGRGWAECCRRLWENLSHLGNLFLLWIFWGRWPGGALLWEVDGRVWDGRGKADARVLLQKRRPSLMNCCDFCWIWRDFKNKLCSMDEKMTKICIKQFCCICEIRLNIPQWGDNSLSLGKFSNVFLHPR